jgi:hypothetical protein
VGKWLSTIGGLLAIVLWTVSAQANCVREPAGSFGVPVWRLSMAVRFATGRLVVDAEGAPDSYRVDGKGLSRTCEGVFAICDDLDHNGARRAAAGTGDRIVTLLLKEVPIQLPCQGGHPGRFQSADAIRGWRLVMSEKSSDTKPAGEHAPPRDHAAERLRQFERARGLDPEQSPENAKGSPNPPLPGSADQSAPTFEQERSGSPGGGPTSPNR